MSRREAKRCVIVWHHDACKPMAGHSVNTSGAVDPEQLLGTWRLVRAVARDLDGREVEPPYGPAPMGRLVLASDGRMMAVLCDARPVLPAGLERNYASYCGNFRIEGRRLITRVDASNAPERLGGDEVREFELRDGALTLKPPRRADGTQRELTWTRDGPP